MGLVKKSITVTDQQNDWIKNRIVNGEYGNDSEYLRDLIRKDKAENEKLVKLKEAIQQGIDSGISESSIEEIIQAVDDRLRKKDNC
ncbi:MAG: type II toxin-antitoxin system ParD family antitoxin [Proteobacteria bacterium]|nr:type II toxin-antitoxin system ParD family antitoxin [Pseudomonadota bacterium]